MNVDSDSNPESCRQKSSASFQNTSRVHMTFKRLTVAASFPFNLRCMVCAACAATVLSLLILAPYTNASSSTSKYPGLWAEMAYFQSKEGSVIVGAGCGSLARAGAVVDGADRDADGTATKGVSVAVRSNGSIFEAQRDPIVDAPGVDLEGACVKAVVDAHSGEVLDAVGSNTSKLRGEDGVGSQSDRADVSVRSSTAVAESGDVAAVLIRSSRKPVESSGLVDSESGRVAGVDVRG